MSKERKPMSDDALVRRAGLPGLSGQESAELAAALEAKIQQQAPGSAASNEAGTWNE